MRVNGFQCDACCIVKSGENSLKDWFAVYDFRKGVESDEQHFCSLHCLREWVQKQLGIINPKPVEIKVRNSIDPDMAIDPDLLFSKEVKIVRAEIRRKEDKDEYWRDL